MSGIGDFVVALMNAERNAIIDNVEPEGVINMTPCPCCGRLVPDTIIRYEDGGRFTIRGLFVYRMDLKSWICKKCDAEFGPDTVRESLKAMCAQPAEVQS